MLHACTWTTLCLTFYQCIQSRSSLRLHLLFRVVVISPWSRMSLRYCGNIFPLVKNTRGPFLCGARCTIVVRSLQMSRFIDKDFCTKLARTTVAMPGVGGIIPKKLPSCPEDPFRQLRLILGLSEGLTLPYKTNRLQLRTTYAGSRDATE